MKKDVTNVVKRSIGKHKGKKPLFEPKRGFKDNIKLGITEIGCEEL